MNENMSVPEVYTSMFKTAGLSVSDDGFVSIVDGEGKASPMTIKGKRLALPTDAILATTDREHIVIFHPGNENFHRSESVVLERYRLALSLHLNQVVGALIHQLLRIGTSTAQHDQLNPDQRDFLIKIKDATGDTIERFLKILGATQQSQMSKLFIKIFMKKGGRLEDREFGRAGIVSFPFYDMLVEEKAKKGTKKICGVTVVAADLTSMIALMEYIFPSLEVKDFYSRGTNVTSCPLLDALMRTTLAISEPINALCDLFSDKEGFEDMRLNVDWALPFSELDTLYRKFRLIPMQNGNEGGVPLAMNDTQAPVAAQAPQVAVRHNGIPSVPGVHPIAAPVNPYLHTPPPQTNLPVVNANGKANFGALIANDPALAAAAGVNRNLMVRTPLRGPARATLSNPVAPVSNGWGTGSSWGGGATTSSWGNQQNNGYQPSL